MNMLIFGNNNATSLHVIRYALQQGHYVTVFMNPGEGDWLLPDDNLTIITGNIYNFANVDEAMQGQETVIELLDLYLSGSAALFTDSTINILKAMQANKVKRLILLSKVGTADSMYQAPWLYRLWLKLLNTTGKKVLANLAIHEALIKQSNIQWTIVRTVAVTNTRAIPKQLDVRMWPGTKLSRAFVPAAAVADFLVGIAARQTYLCEAIGISAK